MTSSLVYRRLSTSVAEAMADTRVVLVMGARQVGKSTLVTQMAQRNSWGTVLTLDDVSTRRAALDDPTGFVEGLNRPVVLDEVQRAPDLLLAIKEAVDQDPSPGQFLLTGSSNILSNRKVKDALTGRIELLTLWPLSQAEINGGANIVETLFHGNPPQIEDAIVGKEAFTDRVATGGYPEAQKRVGRRRDSWFANYLETTLDRDLRDITDALKLEEMPRLLRLLATQASGIMNISRLANRLNLNGKTVKSYVQILETIFFIHRLPAWRPGLAAREIHSPKLHFTDTGLLAHLLGADENRIRNDVQITGPIFENFVVTEIVKQVTVANIDVRAFHYHFDRDEVDLVLESRSGDVVAIEVKAGASIGASDRKGLEKLRAKTGHHFKAGIVIYSGKQTLPLGQHLWAVPVSGLWT